MLELTVVVMDVCSLARILALSFAMSSDGAIAEAGWELATSGDWLAGGTDLDVVACLVGVAGNSSAL